MGPEPVVLPKKPKYPPDWTMAIPIGAACLLAFAGLSGVLSIIWPGSLGDLSKEGFRFAAPVIGAALVIAAWWISSYLLEEQWKAWHVAIEPLLLQRKLSVSLTFWEQINEMRCNRLISDGRRPPDAHPPGQPATHP